MGHTLKKYFLNQISNLSPVEWAEKNRILTKDITPWPGPMNYGRTPYLKEIANSIMQSDPGQVFAIMKGSQIGFSIGGIFTMLGWIIAESPANTLFIVNDDEGLKRAMQGPVDQMINSSGIGHLIKAQNIRSGRNQKTGDTIKGKSFPDGNLYTWSGQSIGKLAQISVKYGLYDEVERYKLADKDSGNFFSLIEKRHRAFKDTKKLYFISTPEIKQTSRIEPLYLRGDQRKYHVPCKACGEMIPLEWHLDVEHLNKKAGVTFEREPNGTLIKESVKYTCQKCGESWPQTHVYDCYDDDLCKWIPTAEPIDEIYRSYHISALYAPAGMDDWVILAKRWCEIHPVNKPIRIEELKAFINQDLGQTWEAQSKSIKINQFAKNTFNYDIGTVPVNLSKEHGNGEIVLLTCAVDLNGKLEDARLDYEVKAWCENGSSYSIDHGSIGTFQRSKSIRSGQSARHKEEEENRVKWTYLHGHKNNVWDEFYTSVMAVQYIKDSGGKMPLAFTGIDIGFAKEQAMEFVNKHAPKTVGLKGPSDNKYIKFDSDKTLFRKSKEIANLYLPEVNRIKDNLSQRIELTWDEDTGIEQPDGFINFPNPDGEKYTMKSYFSQYEGEKRDIELNDAATAIGSRWVKKHSSSVNHFWDCAVYNEAMKEIVTDLICRAAKVPVSWQNFIALIK
jgi:phage terminase large subunit GpA-like protein